MAAPVNLVTRKEVPSRRRRRRFGLRHSILSNTTVYMNPCAESSSQLSLEEAVLFAMAARNFNEQNS